VTVTTNETGHTSNVSWSFLDDTLINAVGGGQDKGGAGGVCNGKNGLPFVPYTGDGPTNNMATANTAVVRDSPGRNRNNKVGIGGGSSQHRPNISTSTFSNVSLSSEEDTDNIPFTGVVNDSSQSVISEISERTGGALDGSIGNTNDAVKALLRDGMECAQKKHNAARETPERRTTMANKAKGLSMIKEGNNGDSSPSRNTHSTAKSTVGEKSKNFLEDIQTTYTRFKTTRNHGQKENKNSILQGIIEDVQFCGLYFCGMDTTTTDDDDVNGDVDLYDDQMKKKKEHRKREAEDTFLGKVVRCGNCGDGSAFCVSL